MGYSSDLTKQRIIEYATQEFLEKGFLNANLRDIAKNAQVTTGAIYNHFGSKDNLFHEIVGDVAEEFFNIFDSAHNRYKSVTNIDYVDEPNLFDSTTGMVLRYFYDHWTIFRLLFCSSSGSEFADYYAKLIAVEEESTLKTCENIYGTLDTVTRFFLHVTSSSSIKQLIEVVHHDLSKEDAFVYMKKIQDFHTAGMKEIFGKNK